MHPLRSIPMGRKYETITDQVASFINNQPMFFVATAPLDIAGHVNLSPKGADSLRVIDRHTVVYADLAGSGAETIAHLRENGRITILWCSFGPKPRILRVHGRGEHLLPDHAEFADMADLFPRYKALRSMIRVHADRIADSCGFGVPEMELIAERSKMMEWADRRSPAKIHKYMKDNNSSSIDGLPAWKG